MLTTIEGVYKDGKVELAEQPAAFDGAEVLVTFMAPEITEREWLRAAMKNPTFDFLHDPEEDIYTLSDGKPFHDEG